MPTAMATNAQFGKSQGANGLPSTRLDIQSATAKVASAANETNPDTARVEK
jgi:hypothetical protein